MIQHLFRRDWAVGRMARNHLGIILGPFALHLEARGHSRNTIHQYLQAAEHFGRWMGRAGIGVGRLDEACLMRFLSRHLPRCRCPIPAVRTEATCRAAVHQLIAYAREAGLAPCHQPQGPRSAMDALIEAYDEHLRSVAGLAPSTRAQQCRYCRDLLRERFGAGTVNVRQLSRRDLVQHVLRRSRELSHSSLRMLAGSLRGFLRFLDLRGHIDRTLINAVPRPAPWPLSTLPDTLSQSQCRALSRSFDRRHPVGKRDYAIYLCLAQLGLRTHEVACLRLENVEWRRGVLRLPQTKQRRERQIPLTLPVLRALANYVRHGRPAAASRALFLRHRAPLGSAVDTHHVRSAMRRAFARAGLSTGRIHLLRHTLATRLHRRKVGLKAIADLLGHRSLDTTARYARVNIEELRQAARPWPRGPR